ncbi:nitrate reductase molybdenum cofactor assembly chaperone [Acerihabitans sp. TG2]|uniref:nitrate reductase molybdenum cofactor assembly chaperone n=1 Tax=Acerihabitans sp. TG2 TaxID=3096008 RepID=UPI002B2220A2|nr:nitrate reductase molybdenum cofactor assembly chaperone [Acerihabitans sp. TG2]MEA9390180.1 nitrate reductase molybdenum cofactor assembly chaperone [Acerihabitans sp. TG2]
MISLKIIGILLDYPRQDVWDHRDELVSAAQCAEELMPTQCALLVGFIQGYCTGSLLDAQETYCGFFDRGRAMSLLLFEHVHGESRDRGQAMVDLLAQYRAAGLQLDSCELPDFLPLYLEYLSLCPPDDAQEGLRDIAPILALLGARLRLRETRFSDLFDLLLNLCESELCSTTLQQQVTGEARDDTPAALDAVWEEEQVTFLGGKGCATAEQTRHQRRFAGAVVPQYLDIGQAAVRQAPVRDPAGTLPCADSKGQ